MDPGNPKVLGADFLHVKGATGPTGPRGNVFMLATATGYERRGIGGAILQKIEECAKKLGLPATIIDFTNDKRELGLQRFYVKHGYKFLRIDSSTKPEKYLYPGGKKLRPVEGEEKEEKQVFPSPTIPLLFYQKTL